MKTQTLKPNEGNFEAYFRKKSFNTIIFLDMNTNDNFLSMDISQNAPLKMILTPTGKKLPLPVMKSVQNLDSNGKTQKKQIYDAHDLSTRICRAYYKFCIGARLGQKSRKLLLRYGVLQYVVAPPIYRA